MFNLSNEMEKLEIETYRLYEHLIFSKSCLFDKINGTKLYITTRQFLDVELS
jgi:hypothetical protein